VPVRVLKYIWALPASLVGAAFACVATLLGASWRWHSGVAEVTLLHRPAAAPALARWFPFSAITFGHVVLALTEKDHAALRAHERVHVAQYERWGGLFLLAYPAESVIQLLRGRRPYLDNRFEVAAREGESKARPSRPSSEA
jgi:hypothetical protein